MRKLLSHIMLMVALVALAVPSMSAQTLAKRGARTSSPQANQVALDKRANGPQMRVRSGKSGYSTNMRQVTAGSLSLPSVSVKNQMREATGGVELWGNVIYSDLLPGSTEERAHLGMWRFNEEGTFLEGYNGELGGCYAAVYLDGLYHNYYVISIFGMVLPYYECYDTNTRQLVTRPVDEVELADLPLSLCTDGTVVYGQHLSETEGQYLFGKFDVNTNTWTDITTMDKQWNACAYGNDGNIYAIDMEGDCYKVVPGTGNATKLGATGAVPVYITSAVVDKKSGRMFWTVCPEDETGNLYEVNTTTGVATKLCQFQYGDEVAGMFIPFIAADDAPAAVENLQANFSNGSLTGTIDFKCPTTLFGGSAATGALTYKVLANDEVVKSGDCSFVQQMSVPVTLAAAGNYTFTVFVTNAAGDGPKAKITTFIGKDTPNPTTVTIAYADGKFNVNWEAVATTVNGGYMDLSKVNYTVTRYPDEVVVGNNVTGTSLQDPVAVPASFTNYYYTVVVNCDGNSSAVAQSNYVALGELTPPYTQTFDTEDVMADYTVFDANDDQRIRKWQTIEGENCVGVQYHSSHSMDDWLFTSGIKLEAGKTYRVSFDTRARGTTFQERIEMKMGQGNTVAAMTTSVIPSTDVVGTAWVTLEAFVTPDATGTYNFGLHGISDPDRFYLYADNFSVSAPMDGGAPGLATDLVVTSDPDGALKANISGKAPLKNIAGQNLTSISKIELARDGNVVNTIENVTPGANFVVDDATVPVSGTYSWTVTCYNDKGAGQVATVSGFVGIDKPGPVTNVQMTENPAGTVTITWDAPEVDIHGTPLGNTTVTYNIVDAADPSVMIAENLTATTYTYQAVPAGEQDFIQLGVFAETSLGTSQGVAGPFLPVGTPYQIPMIESFPGKSLSVILGLTTVAGKGASWSLCADGDLGLNSCDNDGGFIAGKHSALDDAGMIFTGKVDLATAANPAFSFYTYNLVNADGERDINEMEVLVREVGATDWTVLKSGTIDAICNGNADAWNKVSVSLNAYKGKQVQVAIKSICKFFVYCILDNLVVEDQLEYNLALCDIDAPETVKPNEEFTVTAQVENRGAHSAESYTVAFYRNDESAPCKTYTGSALAPGARASYNIPAVLGFGEDDGSVRFHAVVTYDADLNVADNTSDEVTITRKYSDKPAPTNLVGVTEGNRVSLNWTAPAMAPRTASGSLDDLESYTAWSYENVGEWTFIDVDQGPFGGFQGLEVPGSPQGCHRSFVVYEHDEALGFNQTFAGHSGTKSFGSMFNLEGVQNDDWCISPKLSGAAQTVSFWAKSYSASYQDKMEYLYSTSGKEPADFTSIAIVAKVPGEWTEYTAELPAGTNYFAVRNISNDCFLLMLDDFTFETTPDVVVGYNVYRDNVKLNSELITGTSFVDENCPSEGNPGYVVTAVYASGVESAPTGVFYARGVEAIEAGVIVEAGNGFIAIAGAEGKPVNITAVNGIRYYNRVAEGNIRVELAAGVYLVRVANGTMKVVVK